MPVHSHKLSLVIFFFLECVNFDEFLFFERGEKKNRKKHSTHTVAASFSDQETALSLPACDPETAASEVSSRTPLISLFIEEEEGALAAAVAAWSPPTLSLSLQLSLPLPLSLSLSPPLALSAFGGLRGNVKT